MKARILLTLVAFGIALALSAPALASTTTVAPDGSYTVTNVVTTGRAPFGAQKAMKLASASQSDSRYVYVYTKQYNVLGNWCFTVKTGNHWTWSGGSVISQGWYIPTLTQAAWLPLDVTMDWAYGPQMWISGNGHAHWCRYKSIDLNLKGSILKYGVLTYWHWTHEYWLRVNGTYRWSVTGG